MRPLVLLVMLAGLSTFGKDRPLLDHEKSDAFEGGSSVSGVLAFSHCFREPVKVCVPAGSWVEFREHRCTERSSPGCDADERDSELRIVDASRPFSLAGLVLSPHRHLPPDPARELEGHSLEVDDDQDLVVSLARPATVGPWTLRPGRAVLSPETDAEGNGPRLVVRDGVTARAATWRGWSLPQGTAFTRSGNDFSLTAPAGQALRTQTDAHHLSARAVEEQTTGEEQRTSVELLEPAVVAGATFRALTLTRPPGAPTWTRARGLLARPLERQGCRFDADTVVTVGRDGGVVEPACDAGR